VQQAPEGLAPAADPPWRRNLCFAAAAPIYQGPDPEDPMAAEKQKSKSGLISHGMAAQNRRARIE
jgi:hypothetical protein